MAIRPAVVRESVVQFAQQAGQRLVIGLALAAGGVDRLVAGEHAEVGAPEARPDQGRHGTVEVYPVLEQCHDFAHFLFWAMTVQSRGFVVILACSSLLHRKSVYPPGCLVPRP